MLTKKGQQANLLRNQYLKSLQNNKGIFIDMISQSYYIIDLEKETVIIYQQREITMREVREIPLKKRMRT